MLNQTTHCACISQIPRYSTARIYRRRQLVVDRLNRRRQYEYAGRQAELQRQRQVEMERDQTVRPRAIAECASERRRSTLDGGVEDQFDMLYRARVRSMSPRPLSFATGKMEPTKRTTNTPTALPDEFESGSAETNETHQPDTAKSHAAVAGIFATFASLSSNFAFPSHLGFSSSSSSDSPKPAYTPNNGPLQQYEHLLAGLLTRLDAVESYWGSGGSRVRRRCSWEWHNRQKARYQWRMWMLRTYHCLKI
ncbi:hypothetical protein FS749_010318 [Ceratobasidium sp. UAMH 11750]|nr:hypothetical protein FS749_010318 [Ceratobasidium sp. UAMH 11750]